MINFVRSLSCSTGRALHVVAVGTLWPMESVSGVTVLQG